MSSEGGDKGHSKGHSGHAPMEEHEHAEGEGGEEPWLVSYADLMTLLFGFFAMLFTFASFETQSDVKIDKQLAAYFGGTLVSKSEKLTETVKMEMMKTTPGSSMDMKASDEGMEISFITSVLFNSGKADMLPEAVSPVKTLIKIIQSSEPNAQIRVEGHTDDNPISNSVFPSNWELSAARAGAIIRMFQEEGFPEAQLSIAGYGSSRPAFPNRSSDGEKIEDNQTRNRRVIVKVALPKGTKKNPKINIKKT